MKSKKFQKKLSLNKTTVTHLSQGAMKGVRGGATFETPCFDPGPGYTAVDYCHTMTCHCTELITCNC